MKEAFESIFVVACVIVAYRFGYVMAAEFYFNWKNRKTGDYIARDFSANTEKAKAKSDELLKHMRKTILFVWIFVPSFALLYLYFDKS